MRTRKKCPLHGLVLRKDSYSSSAGYCPACGKQLTVVSVPYLFQVYFRPVIMIVPGILAFFYGLGFFLDVRGCVQADRLANAEQKAQYRIVVADIVKNLPEDWQIVYPALDEASNNYAAYNVLSDFLGRLEKGKKMSRLTAEEIRMFIKLMPPGMGDECFELIVTHMGETR